MVDGERLDLARRELAVLSTHGKLHRASWTAMVAANVAVIPIFLLLGAVTVVLTPLIVRRSLAGMSRIAEKAAQIGVDRRGIRLAEAEAPRELVPLVRAVNEALQRLDDGHNKQRRFIVSAAHELRTPIAILRAKIDAKAAALGRVLTNLIQNAV